MNGKKDGKIKDRRKQMDRKDLLLDPIQDNIAKFSHKMLRSVIYLSTGLRDDLSLTLQLFFGCNLRSPRISLL